MSTPMTSVPDSPSTDDAPWRPFVDGLLRFIAGRVLEVRAKLREESIPKCDVQATARAAGIAEQMRSYGIDRTPYFLLARQVAGTIGQTLVCTLSGSSIGAEESLHALFPGLLHIFPMLGGGSHEKPDTAG